MKEVISIGAIGLVVLVLLLIVVGGGLLFLVVLLTKNKGNKPEPAVKKASEREDAKQLPSPEEKKEILEMLANKEISKEEAENRLQGNSE